MAGLRTRQRGGASFQRDLQTVCVILVAVLLLLAPLGASRPVASGWNLSRSAGSSDRTLWRKFTTQAQTESYHRTLLDLENFKLNQQKLVRTESKAPIEADVDFNTMDYANPRSNDPGSSDSVTPPTP